MSKKDFKLQNCVLRVNVSCACDGCKHKVKKLLHKIDGVYSTNIDVVQGKVTVTGNADPLMLIKKLNESGNHSELWGGSQKGSNNNQNQFKNMNQMENFMKELGKGGNNKAQKGGKDQKPDQQMQQSKGFIKNMKMGNKDNNNNNKSVMFNLAPHGGYYDESDFDEYDVDGSDFDGDGEDDNDGEDDDDDQHYNQHHQQPIKGMPAVMTMNDHGKSVSKTGDGGGGGSFELPMNVKGMSGKNDGNKGKGDKNEGGKNGKSDGKNGKGAKNDGKKGKDKKERNKKTGGGTSGGGFLRLAKIGGGILGLGKKSGKDEKKTGSKDGGGGDGDGSDFESIGFDFDKRGAKIRTGGKNGGGNLDKKGGKKGGGSGGGNGGSSAGKSDGAQMMNIKRNGENDRNMGMGNNNPIGQMSGGRNMGMGNNNPMGQMGNFPVVQGHPSGVAAGVGGYFPPGQANPYMNSQQGNPYMNNQQYMAAMMMMNQQRAAGGGGAGMYHPMMYGQPQAAPISYGQAAPPPGADHITHFFNDENTSSCNIM